MAFLVRVCKPRVPNKKGIVPQSIPTSGISVFLISVLRNLAVTVDTWLAGQGHDRNSYLRFRDK